MNAIAAPSYIRRDKKRLAAYIAKHEQRMREFKPRVRVKAGRRVHG